MANCADLPRRRFRMARGFFAGSSAALAVLPSGGGFGFRRDAAALPAKGDSVRVLSHLLGRHPLLGGFVGGEGARAAVREVGEEARASFAGALLADVGGGLVFGGVALEADTRAFGFRGATRASHVVHEERITQALGYVKRYFHEG